MCPTKGKEKDGEHLVGKVLGHAVKDSLQMNWVTMCPSRGKRVEGDTEFVIFNPRYICNITLTLRLDQGNCDSHISQGGGRAQNN